MRDLIIVTIVGLLFYIISCIMEYKAKNFINEKHNIFFLLIMMSSIYFIGFKYSYNQNRSYSMLINVLLTIAILGGYIIFQKNRICFFKKMDKKLVMENKSEIIQIINDYKSNYTNSNSEITFANSKIVFEKVSKVQAEECLLKIGNLLDENRREYTFKDYLIYFIKGHLIPIVLTIGAAFIFFKFISYGLYF